MNRIELPTESIAISSPSSELVDFAGGAHHRTRRLLQEPRAPHTTFAPMHYEPGYAYPLIVWLHHAPGNEHELRQVMPLVSMRNYVGIGPRGTSTDTRTTNAYHWRQTSEGIEAAQARVDHCLQLAQRRFNIHSKRIFLVGHGSGGTMALRLAWSNPARFAGVATIGGPVPTDLQPFRCVKQMRSLPCLLIMARHSRAYPDTRVCADLRLLHSTGCTIAVRQYPGSDDLTTNMLSDLDRWMMEIVCGSKASSTESR